MPPPLLAVEEEQGNFSSPSVGHVYSNRLLLKERNYLGLTDCSLADRFSVSSLPENSKVNLNLQATELRLGLPGSQSPEREPEPCLPSSAKLDAKRLFPLLPFGNGICSYQRNVVSGSKRGFSDTMNEFLEDEGQGKHPNNSGINVILSRRPTCVQPAIKEDVPAIALQEQPATDGANLNHAGVSKSVAPVPKAQVVGWPPIKSTRTKTLATCSKNNEEIDGKPGLGPLFVKVSMDGAPYLRKVDLRIYSTYRELSSALEKMFTCFTLGQCGSQGGPLKEILSESKLKDLLHGSEYVLTYEDKDGDWMLVGDVPWDFFIGTCKKLKIMKSTDAIGLAPRAVEKSKARF